MKKALFLLLVGPLLLASTAGNAKIANAFAKAVAEGTSYSDLIAQPLAGDGIDELVLLSGCKVKLVEQISKERFGIQWRCPKTTAAKRTAAVVDVSEGKISKVLMSTVTVERSSR